MEYVMECCNGSMKARLVAFALAYHINIDTGRAFPGQERLAKATGLSERTVDRQLMS